MKQEYTGLDLSNMLKFHGRLATDCVEPKMFWVNEYVDGRKDSTMSVWKLSPKKPEEKGARFYPAFSKEDFIEKIAPKLMYSE